MTSKPFISGTGRKQSPITGVLLVLAIGACLVWGCAGFGDLKKRYLMAFTYKGEAESVCLVGDFNQWSPESHCLKRKADGWEIVVALSSGPHQYAFVIDRITWVPDPNGMYLQDDGFGRQNSVIMVE